MTTPAAASLRAAPNEVLSDLVRLRLVSLLDTNRWCRFPFLCEATGISGDRLKRHFYLLRSRGYVLTVRGKDGTGWALLTTHGQTQREEHLAQLGALLPCARSVAAMATAQQPDWFRAVEQP
ncbi:transcriptional regulator [Amycolatopsis sp. H20-H5]|uniref:transcriptional regulator n=1 Tax=Amycolatopsis sp. H20-H5 TaxID=3046309 RepID=UPI002DB758D8|nr:transcriptional regulator [Amycolatopsis sp. H20-H5]MEC3974301.1 transcriptional regulator [Amycolatopsis sp. H20-H5]